MIAISDPLASAGSWGPVGRCVGTLSLREEGQVGGVETIDW